jgi:hypothetical protein
MRTTIFLVLFPLIVLIAQTSKITTIDIKQGWKVVKAEGVDITIEKIKGKSGNAFKLNYNFIKGAGYGGVQKKIPFKFSGNYRFSFYIRADSPNNNLEFKLLDSAANNVWWSNNRNFEFPSKWEKFVINKRDIQFAWGPGKDKELQKTEYLEFTIASYNGGKGSVSIDGLEFEEIPDQDSSVQYEYSSIENNREIKNAFDGNNLTTWKSITDKPQEIIINFHHLKEYGGLVIDWEKYYNAEKFEILSSDNMLKWEKLYTVKRGNPEKNYIYFKNGESVYLKIKLIKSDGNRFGIKDITIKEHDFSSDINNFFISIANDNPRGYFPRYLNKEASYWTICGVNGDNKEALINEDGMVEVDKLHFSVEPFIYSDNKLITWNDVKEEQQLEKNYMPVPSVLWDKNSLQLQTKIFTDGKANKNSVLYIVYTLQNKSSILKEGNFYLTFRPMQVNPYYQFLNNSGGIIKIHSIKKTGRSISVNSDKVIIPIMKEDRFGACTFDEGDISYFISKDSLPLHDNVKDNFGFASGALQYNFKLLPGEEKTYALAVPFYKANMDYMYSSNLDSLLNTTKTYWDNLVTNVKFKSPESADKFINTIYSNLSYILINRDSVGIQPGSRSYERSWIRDGALTSSALLKFGITKEVKEFIEWYSVYQSENGKIPCVVDRRGADPVSENDSNGEYLFLLNQYFKFTGDTSFLRSKFLNIKKAVGYLEYLISLRSTDFYKSNNDSIHSLYGLLPESISHEGYSAKPMHSYWDDFFALRGLKDAVAIAKVLNEYEWGSKVSTIKDKFKNDLYNSINLTIKRKGIDYIPGCAELGDFDATSTSIGVFPCGELNNMPKDKLKSTFDKYFQYFEDRKNSKINWDGYTPYELRIISSLILMGEIEHAHELMEFFFMDQRPMNWNQWAEVVWKDYRKPAFIGDMPHTWVGSEFLNAARNFIVYENESDSSLVIGAGLYKEWIDSPMGISFENLPTYYGNLSYSIKKENNNYKITIRGNLKIPSGKIILKNFNKGNTPMDVVINNKKSTDFFDNEIIIKDFPAEVNVRY